MNNNNALSDCFARDLSRNFILLILPVTVTMLVTVWSAVALPPLSDPGTSHTSYREPITDVGGGSGETSLLPVLYAVKSAAITIGFITAVTLLVLVLYKYGCGFVLYGWLLYSCASLFFVMTWVWLRSVFHYFGIPYTIITMGIFVWNFGVVGVVSVIYYSHPMVRQGYLIFASIMVACVLIELPEWTAWTLLFGIALYDIIAVLCPFGPLRLLVEESNRRSDPLPGFVYDTDPRVVSAPAPLRSDAPRVPSLLYRRYMAQSSGKLGLGDFIFYSVLVGKAAQHGYIEWTFCLVTILIGMVGTFMVLLFYRDRVPALPALPLSIFMGMIVYFIARFGVSPLAIYASSQGLLI